MLVWAMNLRNLGPGIKIYKSIIADLGYVTSSESDANEEVRNSLSSDMVWHSLNDDREVHIQTNETKIIAVLERDREKFKNLFLK